MTWDAPWAVDVLRGDLDAMRASEGDFQGTVLSCYNTSSELSQPFQNPDPGKGFYYLVREAGPIYACSSSWGTGSPAELPGAGGDRDADLALDPNACP